MSVEMNYAIWMARVRGRPQHLREALIGWRPQHVKIKAMHLFGATLDQGGGHGPVGHIIAPLWPADYEQNSQSIRSRLRN